MSEVTLEVAGENSFKNYLAVCSIRVDTSRRGMPVDEKGFYSSALNLYQVKDGKLNTCLVENYKRSITCVSSFLGKLVCTMVFLNWQDLCLVLWTFNKNKACLENPQAIPDGACKNLATCVSFDQDFMILGDAYKNLTVLKKSDAVENQKQKLESDKLHVIKYTKNDLDVNVVGAFSMSRHLSYDKTDLMKNVDKEGQPLGSVHMMSEQGKRMLNIVAVSRDGYARMFKMKESKQLEVFAQLNFQDKVLSAKPLSSSRDELCERRLAVVTQRSGIQIVTPCPEKQFNAVMALTKLMSHRLPFQGGLTPLHALQEPLVPQVELQSFNQRLNEGAVSMATSVSDFHFLNSDLQESIASEAGYSLSHLY